MDIESKSSLPDAIFLETSSLWGVAHRDDDPSLQTLARYCKVLRIPLLTSRLVVAELAENYREELKELRANLESAANGFERRRIVTPTVTWSDPYEETINRLPEIVGTNFEKYGVQVVEDQKADQDRLVRMAIKKEPPFTKRGEKGFRDAIILYTVVGYCRDRELGSPMLISNDDPIEQACALTQDFRTPVITVVKSITAAREVVNNFVSEMLRQLESERREACRRVLLEHWDEIENFVKQHVEFPESALRHGKVVILDRVEEILDLKLGDLRVTAVGELPKEDKEGRVRISLEFDASVKAVLSPILPAPPPERSLRVGEQSPPDPVALAISRRLHAKIGARYERDFPVTLEAAGTVHVRRDGTEEVFSEPEIDQVEPKRESPWGLFRSLLAVQLPDLGDDPKTTES